MEIVNSTASRIYPKFVVIGILVYASSTSLFIDINFPLLIPTLFFYPCPSFIHVHISLLTNPSSPSPSPFLPPHITSYSTSPQLSRPRITLRYTHSSLIQDIFYPMIWQAWCKPFGVTMLDINREEILLKSGFRRVGLVDTTAGQVKRVGEEGI